MQPKTIEWSPQVYTVEEAAALLKVNKKTIYRLVSREKLRTVKALRHLRITHKSMEEFVGK